MSRRQIVIPGTGGVLYTNVDGDQAASIFDLVAKQNGPQILRCKHPADPADLEPIDNGLTPSGHMTLAYEPFDHAFPKWSFFEYDWRLDIRRSGAKLADYLEERGSTGDRWRMVAHSQGGLVVLAAARKLGVDRLTELVQSVCFVGVPFFGTVSALSALLAGTLFNNTVPKDVVRTWPSVYQMMPSWSIFDAAPTNPDLLLDGTWAGANLLPSPGEAPDLTKHVDPAMLERARAFHKESLGAFEPLRKLDFIRIIQGNNLNTDLSLPNFPDGAGKTPVMGDTLVPDQFTRDRLPSWVKDEATVRRLPAADHMLLCSDPNVFAFCQ